MHMLAEHRELLGEVAVQPGHVLKARPIGDAALGPMLKGMGAAAAYADAQAIGGVAQGVAQGAQFAVHTGKIALHMGGDLDHAFGDLELHIEVGPLLGHDAQQIGGTAGQVGIARVDQLQFEFDAERQRVGTGEFEALRHRVPQAEWSPVQVFSLARRKAISVAIGPMMARMATTANTGSTAVSKVG